MLSRGFALLFGCTVAVSWVAPLCAVSAPLKSAMHGCCQVPTAPRDASKPCCRPLDSAALQSEMRLQPSLEGLLPVAAAPSRGLILFGRVVIDSSPLDLGASPPSPTGLSPPASA